MWSDWADKNGWIVLAPQFDDGRFNNDFQRLNLNGLRADERLQELVKAVGDLLPGLYTKEILMFGFSAGGQFVHRYVAFNPKRVDRAVAAAAGLYLWPDRSLPYPIGTDPASFPGDLRPQLVETCRMNLLVLTGENDSTQGAFRKNYDGYDLSVLQGESRRARAGNWVNAMKDLAEQKGYPFSITYEILPKAKHVVSGRLIDSAGQFLLGNV
jgi:pimeloyl-ACP methyl ester carboxylesterase